MKINQTESTKASKQPNKNKINKQKELPKTSKHSHA
jgi:hypothetical protein